MKQTILNSDWVTALALFFPILIVGIEYTSELAILILSGVGAYQAFKNPFQHNPENSLKLYSAITLGFFFIGASSVIGSENTSEGLHEIGSSVHFLLAPLVAYALSQKVLWPLLLKAFKISCIIACIIALFQSFAFGIVRAQGGATASTLFGIILAMFSYFSLVNIFNEPKQERILSVIAFICAVIAIILSQTRVAIIIMIALPFIMITLWAAAGHINRKTLALCAGGVFFTIAILASSNTIQDRFSLAKEEFNSFFLTESIDKSDTSIETAVGLRLAMWESGYLAFKEKPLRGHGLQNTNTAAAKHVYNPVTKAEVARFEQLHNDYINSLVGMGALGFTGFLGLTLVPLVVFIRRLKVGGDFGKNAIGIIFIIGCLISALTDSIYTSSTMRAFYIFMLAVTLVNTSSGVKAPK